MSDLVLVKNDLTFDGYTDNDGEMNVVMPGRGEYGTDAEVWINRDDALKIIQHLNKYFKL